MGTTIEDHDILLSGINPKAILDRQLLNQFFSSLQYQREAKFHPSERYPHGATASGMMSIKRYPEGNGFEALIEDHKFHTQNETQTYQTPRKIFFHIHQDKEGHGRVTCSSNHGTNLQGVITKVTDREFEFILHGASEHLGQEWVKGSLKKEDNGVIQSKYFHCTHHDDAFSLYQEVTVTPIT